MRVALNRLAAVAPAWLQTHLLPVWLERYAARADNDRLPRTEAERQRLAATIGAEGFALLQAVYAPEPPRRCGPSPRWRSCAASGSNHMMGRAIRGAGGTTGMCRRRRG